MTSIRTVDKLLINDLIHPEDATACQQVAERFSISITDQIKELITALPDSAGIKNQFVPQAAELAIKPEELTDPIGDECHEKVHGLIHRYPDRCLLKVVNVCPVYCRFCFRREFVGPGNEAMTPAQLQDAYDYIQAHPALWEIILTGGDPLILPPEKIKQIFANLNAIEHVGLLRIHTRVPAVDSKRITPQMIKALKSSQKALFIALHVNHPDEFTAQTIKACAAIVDAGIPLLSQTVLLKGINDNIDTLSNLMRCFVKNRIKPYYLHHCDLARGSSHFRTTIAEGQALMAQLRGYFSGICLPTYVLDIPGGYGKIPIEQCYLQHLQDANNNQQYLVTDYRGQQHIYDVEHG